MTEPQPMRASRRAKSGPVDVPSEFLLVPSNRQRLGDQLYGQILDHIVSGRLKEGDRLPPEKEICELFGVSRPTVREALLRLRADGLIQARQGAGTFVINRPAARLTNFTSSADVAGYLRCVEVRMPLEGVAARLAAERRTPEQLKKIEQAHEEFANTIKSGNFGADEDLAFHARIAEATGNEFFSHILKNINHALIGFMRVTLNLTRTGSKERASKVVDEHKRIVEAIRAQDGEEASNAMQFHIGQARRRLTDRKRDRSG